MKEIISFFSNEIIKIIYPKRTKRRRDLWTVCEIAFSLLYNQKISLELKNGETQRVKILDI